MRRAYDDVLLVHRALAWRRSGEANRLDSIGHAMPLSPDTDADVPPQEPLRCVIVVNQGLPPGKAANAAAVVALTLGQRHPALVGAPLVDADNTVHPGLIPVGIPILAAPPTRLATLRAQAATQCDTVDFPAQGQRTNDYAEFRSQVARAPTAELVYLAVGVVGRKKLVSKLVSGLPLLA